MYIYSIIILHYNIPHLLDRCLSSISERNDTQMVVIDDNSPNSDSYTKILLGLSRKNLKLYLTHEGKEGKHSIAY
ncbi:glycosyltransferase [Parabacteroides distasonis]|nr:glycosyltransferase [Parabacteroides distasonis]